MRIVDLIEKKRLKQILNEAEIKFLISNYVANKVPDYQMSALLMTIMFNGMTSQETAILTREMMISGKIINLNDIEGIKVDKHSTGGVGDKTTLAVAPIVAACGVAVAKMTGRGLGHTGGTVDKLESIPNFNATLSLENFKKHVEKYKIAIISQSDELVPADKKLYALRDVTNCIQSIPLIASSIMSKKLATGANTILLDIKCGAGAFMKNLDQARLLAKEMIKIGKSFNVDVKAEITNMNQVIGKEIGNKNEVIEAIRTLKAQGPDDFTELVYSSASTILKQAKIVKTTKEAHQKIDEVIKNGKALNKFYEFVELQGGNSKVLFNEETFWKPEYKYEIKAQKEGYLEVFNSYIFGIVAMKLGAGRQTKEENIDFEAGITLNKKTNEYVKKGDLLFTLYSSNQIDKSLEKELQSGYKINKDKVKNKIILEELS